MYRLRQLIGLTPTLVLLLGCRTSSDTGAGPDVALSLTPTLTATSAPLPAATLTPSPTVTPTPTPLPVNGSIAPEGAFARLGRGPASVLALSPAGEIVAIGSPVAVYLYQEDTLADVRYWPVTTPVRSLAWSPDGTWLAVGFKGHIDLYDPDSGSVLIRLEGPDEEASFHHLAWSPDGMLLASASTDDAVTVWDSASSERINQMPGNIGAINDLTWSADGKAIAYLSGDLVLIRGALTGERLLTFEGHNDTIYALATSPDGSLYASSSLTENTVQIWQADSGERQRTLYLSTRPGFLKGADDIRWSPDGSLLAVGENDGDITLWDTETGTLKKTIQGHEDKGVSDLAWVGDGQQIISCGYDEVILWDVETGDRLAERQGHTSVVNSLAWFSDGLHLAAGYVIGDAVIWNTRTGEPEYTMGEPDRGGTFDSLKNVMLSPDETLLAYSYWNSWQRSYVVIRDALSGEQVRQMSTAEANQMPELAWSPDGGTIAASANNTILLFDVTTGARLATLRGHNSSMMALAYAPDGTMLASASYDKTLILWNPAEAELLRILEGHSDWVSAAAWSPDGTRLASGSRDQSINIWDPFQGEILQRLTDGHDDDVQALAWSPDGAWLASGSQDTRVILWDTTTWEKATILDGHTNSVTALAWSPDGSVLASASVDGTIVLWNHPN